MLTIGSNADTLKIVNTLWRDPTVRSATIAQAQAYVDQANKTATTPVSTPPLAPAEQGSDNLKAASKNLADAIDRLDTLSLPLGWDSPCIQGQPCKTNLQIWPGFSRAAWLGALNEHSLGWLMTALVISLGAPFWFDMLNKVMSIRSAGKAPEEKPREPRAVPQPQQPGQNA